MQFMITFNHIEGVWERLSDEDQEKHNVWLGSFMEKLSEEKNSHLVFLAPNDERKAIRKHENGDLEVTDGPAVPGPEQVGGYFVIEAQSIEEAIEWAKRGRWLVGSNEVRQILSLST